MMRNIIYSILLIFSLVVLTSFQDDPPKIPPTLPLEAPNDPYFWVRFDTTATDTTRRLFMYAGEYGWFAFTDSTEIWDKFVPYRNAKDSLITSWPIISTKLVGDTVQIDGVLVWKNDTILKDSLVYVDIKPDSLRVRYIDGTYSKWYWTGDKVKEVVGDSLENYVTSNVGLTANSIPVATAGRNIENSGYYWNNAENRAIINTGDTIQGDLNVDIGPSNSSNYLNLITEADQFAVINFKKFEDPVLSEMWKIMYNAEYGEDNIRIAKTLTGTTFVIGSNENIGIGKAPSAHKFDVNGSYAKEGSELKLDAHKSGSLGDEGDIYVGVNSTSTPVWKSHLEAGIQDTLTFYETMISVDDDVGHTVPFVLRPTAHVWFNGTLLKQDDWVGVGTTELTILGNVKIYDYIKIQN